MTKIQLIATLCAMLILALFGSCSNDDQYEVDLYKVTPELRARINTGMKLVPKSAESIFDEKYELFITQCYEKQEISNPYKYLETEEYQDFKNYILNSSITIHYLLIDKYLKRNPVFISYILNDIIETSYPEVADRIATQMKSSTVHESIELYPQVCLELWMDAFENY